MFSDQRYGPTRNRIGSYQFVGILSAVLFASPTTASAQRALGVDVSQFQGAIDWSVVKAPTSSGGGGKDFAFIRATRGGTWGSSEPGGANTIGGGRYDDTAFLNNITTAKAAGVLAGAYHLARIDLYNGNDPNGAVTPEDEAQHFLQIAGAYMSPGYLRPVLDIETNSSNTKQQVSDYVNRFVSAIVAAKGERATPIVYTGVSFANDYLNTSVTSSPLWLARPGGSPNVQTDDPAPIGSFANPYGPWDPSGTASPKPWSFWQYGTSSVPGMEIGTDLDVAHGDLNYVSSFLIPTVTWTGNGANNNWSNNANWNPNQPLNHDTVVFGSSPQTNVRADFSSYPDTDPQRFNQPALHLESVTFAAGAPSRSIELYTSAETSTFYQANLTFDGAGVTNSSAVEQTFVVDKGSLRALAGGQYTGVDGSTLTFNNSASAGTNVTYEAKGGLTTFFSNPAGTILFLRPSGGSIIFNNSASAAGATFIARGGGGNGGLRSRVEFHNSSTAASGTFFNNAGAPAGNAPGEYPPVVCGFGGETIFFDTASAGTAHFTNDGTVGPGGSGGVTTFTQNSSAANGVFVSNPTTDTSGIGNPGIVQFLDSATAANGTFTNNGGAVAYSNGRTEFGNNSTAANALIENLAGASNYFGATTTFHDHASAGSAVINNRVHSGMGAGLPPVTSFRNESTAGAATIHNWGSSASGTDYGGRTEFYDHATAANAHIILEPGNHGGTIVFNNDSSAAAATIDATANNTNGTILFKDQSTAANAVIALGSTNSGQFLTFSNDASAGNSTITIGKQSSLLFYNKSTAANSHITMGSNSSLFFAGSLDGPPASTAGSATIHLVGGTASASGATATFANFSTAASANITVDGAADANPVATGAAILFGSNANAGSANIFLKSGPATGSAGGLLYFNGGGSGPMARVITEAGSLIYVAGNVDYGTTVGSIEGPADVSLGGSKLTVGGLNLSTTLGGTIIGAGGQLTKIGSGRLTVSGANTFNGLTTVEAGEFALTGSVGGNVDVKAGATFLGIGNVRHDLICEDGSRCLPGLSPGTLTVGGLNLMSGSTLQYELGAGAVRDRIVVTNNGSVVLGGLLDLSLLDGFDPALGQTFSLFEGSIGSVTGRFSAVNAPIFNGHALNLVYGMNQVTLVVGEAGDFNGDGAVNAADYVVWRKGLGTTFTQTDYDVWRAHFGQTGGNGSGAIANAAVPEPASLVLTLFAITGCCLRRRAAA